MLDREALARIFAQETGLKQPNNSDPEQFPGCLTATNIPDMYSEFRARYQLYNLNRKAETKGVTEVQRQEAFKLFLALNYRNRTFKLNTDCDILKEARAIVHQVLVPLEFVESEVAALCTFGPGTFHGALKTARRGLGYSLVYKVGPFQTVTAAAKPLVIHWIAKYFPRWGYSLVNQGARLKTVEGNKLSHVPKDVNKCRPIAIEPSLNVFAQQGIGRWIGRRMKAMNFADIYDQEPNRVMAGDLRNGTIDLSNASDTISVELVKYLLPRDWYELMSMTRSPSWEFRDQKGTHYGFSSQGNAFTFPLETLIFKAIALAATKLDKSEVTVYGDDIIAPVEHCPTIISALESAGFIINVEKSYYGQHEDARKYFRESCGADYFLGLPVTPVYVRKDPASLSELAVVHNRFLESWPGLTKVQAFLLECIPDKLRRYCLYGPRYFITDRPEKVISDKRVRNVGINSIVSTYDSWFWSEGILEGTPPSKKAWGTRPTKVGRDAPNSDAALLAFLLSGEPTLARTSKPVTRRIDVTPWNPPLGGLIDPPPLLKRVLLEARHLP